MPFKSISLKHLVVNPSNDRHGPLGSERDAIHWLLQNKASEMRVLATDIATQLAIYDPPLVKPEGKTFIVHDGNRRTSCLKLINDPNSAPEDWQKFFTKLRDQFHNAPIESIECQIENDQKRIDQILERRHNGKQDGAGQLKWDTRAKSNHAERVGGKSAYPLAEKIEEYLLSLGYNYASKIKRSNLDKLIDTKARKARVGVELDQTQQLKFTKPKEQVSETLFRIAEDLRTSRLSLKELLLAEDKEAYLDSLKSDGFGTDAVAKSVSSPDTISKPAKPAKTAKPTKPRDHLIPPSDVGISWSAGQTKIQRLWHQLQWELTLSRHTLSVAVVFRVFLEQLTTSSCAIYAISDSNKLASNISKLSNKLSELGVFDHQQCKDIKRISEDKSAVNSIESLQRVLHSKSYIPTERDLRAMWDSLEPFIVALAKKQKSP